MDGWMDGWMDRWICGVSLEFGVEDGCRRKHEYLIQERKVLET